MLSDPCLSVCLSVCLSCLSVTLLYCGQTVGRINMKLGMQVSLGPGHIVLDRDPCPASQTGTAPNFRPTSVVAKWLDGSVTDGDMTRWWNVQLERRSGTKSPLRVHVCHTMQFSCKVWQSHAMQATEGKHSEFEFDPLWRA